MKWVLIAIHLSSWDLHPTKHEQIAEFTDRSTCLEEVSKMGKFNYVRFVCANEAKP